MRYWVYINDKVDGPYDETNLVTLEGFTPDTLICSEEVASSGGQEWVKASSIFEFDEIPANEEPAPQAIAQPQPDAQTQALLAQLELLTSGMSNLQSKLDSMQHNLDHALEQNQKLSEQVAQLSHPVSDMPLPDMSSEDSHTNTITLTRHDIPSKAEEGPAQEEPSFPAQAAPEEEEVIIRSALDSLYGGKPIDLEDTFQDLMPEKTAEQQARKAAEEEQAVRNIEPELEFIPLQEENKEEDKSSKPQPEQPAPAVTPVSEETAEPLPAEALDEIEKELTSLSLGATQETQTETQESVTEAVADQPELKEAVITTPGLEETAKDALINELTASPKEDILDQIIAEHQQEASVPQEESHAASVALGAAAAGLAAASLVSLVDKKEQEEPAPMAIATDKENPEKLEEVLPADQMPQNAPAPQPVPEEPADLPSLEETPVVTPAQEPEPQETTPQIPVADTPEQIPQAQEEEPTTPDIPVAQNPDELPQPVPEAEPAPADLPGLDQQNALEQQAVEEQTQPQDDESLQKETIEELVPNVQTQETEQEGFYIKEETTTEETPQEPTPAQDQSLTQPPAEQQEQTPHAVGVITNKDLQDAFGNDDTPVVTQPITVGVDTALPESNPNELTEIELKEGSTYLISDFVPPAQVTDNMAETSENKEEEKKDKNQETAFQDMLAAATKAQTAKPLATDGQVDDLAATQINLENTIQAKRGASLDIKTVPMVPEPEGTERLDMNELNDVNAQHGVKTFGKLAKSTKMVIMVLIGLLALIILYVLLGMMKLLPASVNLFAGKQTPAVEQTTQEILSEPQPAAAPAVEEEPQTNTLAQQAQEKVQNFPLPNGFLLKDFIVFKHGAISPELITWETTEAVEADNYSVTVKVPPENPQNFKTVYRFNYNMLSGLLDPTVSDAKNLLDQAYGVQPAQQPATTTPAKKATTRTGTRKGTGRRRAN